MKDDNIEIIPPAGIVSPTRNQMGLPTGKNKTYKIPVVINNGAGSVILSAFPEGNAQMEITNVTLHGLLPIPDFLGNN